MKGAWIVFLLMLATGAAAREKDSGPDAARSEALQIARAAHLDMHDDPAATFVAAEIDDKIGDKTEGGNGGSSLAMGAIGVGQATKVFKAPRGFSASGAAATSILVSLMSGNAKTPEDQARMMAWISADSPQEAQAKAMGYVETALKQTLPDVPIRFVPKVERKQAHLAIDMPNCEQCRFTWLGMQEHVKPRLETTPTFIDNSGSQRYAWGHPKKQGDGLLMGYPLNQPSMTRAERQAFLRTFSAHLPIEMAVFVPASIEVADYPVVFHQGKMLRFEQPATNATTTAKLDASGGAASTAN